MLFCKFSLSGIPFGRAVQSVKTEDDVTSDLQQPKQR